VRLNLLFIAMVLLSLLAYPILFVDGVLRRFLRSREICATGKSTNYWFGRSRRMIDQKTSLMRKTKVLRMTES
jgi:hypothetical protein